MDALPNEVLAHMLAFMCPRTVATLGCVSVRLSLLTADEALWKRFYLEACPPCADPLACLLHVGRGLDSTPWTAAPLADSDPHWGRLLSHPPSGHPLMPALLYGVDAHRDIVERFVARTLHACPHHCASVIGARDYRWAWLSTQAPRKCARQGGSSTHVGSFDENTIPNSFSKVHLCYEDVTGGTYSGECVYDCATSRWVPHGVGMILAQKMPFQQQQQRQQYQTYGIRTISTWDRGRPVGTERRWSRGTIPKGSNGMYIESSVHDTVSTSLDVRSGVIVQDWHGTGKRPGGSLCWKRVADGRSISYPCGSWKHHDVTILDARGTPIYRGGMHCAKMRPDGNGTLYAADGSVLYKGDMCKGVPTKRGSLCIRSAVEGRTRSAVGSGAPLQEEEEEEEEPHNDGMVLAGLEEAKQTWGLERIDIGWQPNLCPHDKASRLDGPAFASAHLFLCGGVRVQMSWTGRDTGCYIPVIERVVIPPFEAGIDPCDAPVDRIRQWDVVCDTVLAQQLEMANEHAAERFRMAWGHSRSHPYMRRLFDHVACFFWPRPTSLLAPHEGRSDDTTEPRERVTQAHAMAFVAWMARRYPHWGRCCNVLATLYCA